MSGAGHSLPVGLVQWVHCRRKLLFWLRYRSPNSPSRENGPGDRDSNDERKIIFLMNLEDFFGLNSRAVSIFAYGN